MPNARADRLEHRQRCPRRGLEALAAGEPGAEGRDATRQRFDLAHVAAGIGVALVQIARRIDPFECGLFGLDHPDVGQPEIGGKRVAIAERLLEMLAGVEEDDRQRSVDLGDHVQQHRRIRAEGRDRGDLVVEQFAGRAFDDLERLQMTVERIEPRRFGGDAVIDVDDTVKRPWLRQHRAPP